MIVKTVILRCDPERAFALFTEHAGLWWPTERRHTDDASSIIRLEATGRFYERASDGTEVEMGVVRVFEPHHRLLLDWFPGTGPARPTLVDIRFEALETGTRLTIAHGPGAAGEDLFGRNAHAYRISWDFVLDALTERASRALDIS